MSVPYNPWRNFHRKIDRLAKLEKGWDSYDADPPSPLAVKNAKKILKLLEKQNRLPVWVEMSSDKSIVMEVYNGENLEEWDCYNDGEICILTTEFKDGEEIVKDCRLHVQGSDVYYEMEKSTL